MLIAQVRTGGSFLTTVPLEPSNWSGCEANCRRLLRPATESSLRRTCPFIPKLPIVPHFCGIFQRCSQNSTASMARSVSWRCWLVSSFACLPRIVVSLEISRVDNCLFALTGHYHSGGECLDTHGVTHLTIEAPLTYGLDGEHDEGQWPFADVEVERDRLLEAGTLHIGHLHCFGNGVRKSRSIHLPSDVRLNVLHTLRSRGLQHKGLQHPLQHQTSAAGAKQQPRL